MFLDPPAAGLNQGCFQLAENRLHFLPVFRGQNDFLAQMMNDQGVPVHPAEVLLLCVRFAPLMNGQLPQVFPVRPVPVVLLQIAEAGMQPGVFVPVIIAVFIQIGFHFAHGRHFPTFERHKREPAPVLLPGQHFPDFPVLFVQLPVERLRAFFARLHACRRQFPRNGYRQPDAGAQAVKNPFFRLLPVKLLRDSVRSVPAVPSRRVRRMNLSGDAKDFTGFFVFFRPFFFFRNKPPDFAGIVARRTGNIGFPAVQIDRPGKMVLLFPPRRVAVIIEADCQRAAAAGRVVLIPGKRTDSFLVPADEIQFLLLCPVIT